MEYRAYSIEDTKKIASSFAQDLGRGDVLCLYGDLGVGKTVFAQGIAEGLHIQDYITSPTFTIVNVHDGIIPFYHFDVYRISDIDEMYEIGFEEYLNGESICLIEWSEKIEDILPEKRYDIKISKDDTENENFRLIEINKRG